jgi:Domain of unknown function (DUF4123)
MTALALFFEAAKQTRGNWYALADSAQNPALPRLISSTLQSRCLFDVADDAPLAQKAPHLVELPTPNEDKAWKWIERNAPHQPSVTVIQSSLGFAQLHTHLQKMTEIILPDNEDMFFGFWDPATLGSLTGQLDDQTLHIAGPILKISQLAYIAQGIEAWWYWDREGALHSLPLEHWRSVQIEPAPWQLDQQQVDGIVEAGLPDQILYHIQLNQPHLFDTNTPAHKRYRFVRTVTTAGQDIGLETMRDLTNFTSLALAYGVRMNSDALIKDLILQVQQKNLTLEEAMTLMPE